jgi:hypothetical protein
MTSVAAASLDRPAPAFAAIRLEQPIAARPAANARPVALLSDFARAMRRVEQEVYGID